MSNTIALPVVIASLFVNLAHGNNKVYMTEQHLTLLKNEYSYMIDFTRSIEADNWWSTNDGVMGGISQGQLTYTDKTSVFSGTISLENNGGFSSVYREVKPLPEGLDTVDIEVAGDGSVYQLRMAVFVNGYRLAYKHEFSTTSGQRERIKLKLSDFKASFRGRLIQGAPELTSENISETGFLLTRKVAGTFTLTLYRLEIYRTTDA